VNNEWRIEEVELTWLAVVEQCREQNAAVPVACEICHATLGQGGLQPRQHELPGRELAPADLVAHDERPDEAEDELEVAIHDVHVANVHELDVVGFDGVESGRGVLQVVMLVLRPLVPRRLQLSLLQRLDQRTEMRSIAKVDRQIGNLVNRWRDLLKSLLLCHLTRVRLSKAFLFARSLAADVGCDSTAINLDSLYFVRERARMEKLFHPRENSLVVK
jgi:hypothetical protein